MINISSSVSLFLKMGSCLDRISLLIANRAGSSKDDDWNTSPSHFEDKLQVVVVSCLFSLGH